MFPGFLTSVIEHAVATVERERDEARAEASALRARVEVLERVAEAARDALHHIGTHHDDKVAAYRRLEAALAALEQDGGEVGQA